ncbi:MAG: acyl-CoA dehydrogenase family protein [Alphaproteobacteria bacterium]|nr:acyl-CoA dehydrogenase family protein [Alphaproteobacteria bacterium]MDP6517026.1 acyl-CoA dehydrogenase family protein [Alphaproteobacteria bacterium]
MAAVESKVAETGGEYLARARALARTLADRAAETEALRRLPDATIADFHRTGLFRVIQPARAGGPELTFREYVDVCVEVARGCASSSWVMTNVAAHHWMLGLWPVEAQDQIWGANPDAIIASGLSFPCGKATRAEGGFRLSGRWPFSSGVDPANWNVLAGSVGGGDRPEQRYFMVPADDYEIIDDWHVAGLAGTGSKSVAAEDIFVPEHLTLSLDDIMNGVAPGLAVNTTPLFRLPLFAMFPYVVVPIALGTAKAALDHFVGTTRQRVSKYTGAHIAALAPTQMRLAEASAAIDAAERILRGRCEEVTAMIVAGQSMPLEQRAVYRRDGAYAAKLCVRAVDILFEGTGGNALYGDNPMQRHFRDVHAAAGHFVLGWDAAATTYGQIHLGLPFNGNL